MFSHLVTPRKDNNQLHDNWAVLKNNANYLQFLKLVL